MEISFRKTGICFFLWFLSGLLTNQVLYGQSASSEPVRFQHQNEQISYNDEAQPLALNDGRLMLVYTSSDSILCSRSINGGISWDTPSFITSFSRSSLNISAVVSSCITETNRIVVIFSLINKSVSSAQPLQITYSDDKGITWSVPKNVYSGMSVLYPSIAKGTGNKLWISGRVTYLFLSTDNGNTWSPKSTGFTSNSLAVLSDNSLIAFNESSESGKNIIQFRKSTDDGQSWSAPFAITAAGAPSESRPRAITSADGAIWLVYQINKETPFAGYSQYDIYYKKSMDKGASWSQAAQLTKYAGSDFDANVTLYNSKPFISFQSERYFNAGFQNGLTPYGRQVWLASIGDMTDTIAPAAVFTSSNSTPVPGVRTSFKVYALSHAGISSVSLTYKMYSRAQQFQNLFDDGLHNDEKANDNIWGGDLPAMKGSEQITYGFKITDKNNNISYHYGRTFIVPFKNEAKWLTVGSLQDWYSSMGSEREIGIINPQTGGYAQQTGWQWPADHKLMDSKVSTGLWLGAKNFTDLTGNKFQYKIVHSGPRVSGTGEFFPVIFYMKSRYPKPSVLVNGNPSYSLNDAEVDSVDPSMSADREIVSVCNTQLGLTLTRHIFQFAHPYHDNYIIQEYTLTNTGDTDGDTSTIELPENTLDSVMMFYQAKIATSAYSRYVIGNATGWGVNTTIDTRGDGVKQDPSGENFRAQFAWHGRYPAFTQGDNIGGPIWTVQTNITKGDTIGRLTAFQFAGVVTLHADKSPADKADDPKQPITTSTIDSDSPLLQQNDAMNKIKMSAEYQLMTAGHDIRHLDKIGETNPVLPTKDPGNLTMGGHSFANGYGPYTLKHGESVKVIIAQASAGMGWEAGEKTGKEYKAGKITALQKNTEVFKGKDSLFTSFRRAMDNFKSGWKLPLPPAPPKSFIVNSYDKGIQLSWTLINESDPSVQGFQVFRADGSRDSTYRMIAELPAQTRSFSDTLLSRGVNYYYNLRTVGKFTASDPALNIPSVRLTSSKYYTQTYLAAAAGTTGISAGSITPYEYRLFNNFPNPFNPTTTLMYSIPKKSHVVLRIYDMLGREAATLVNEQMSAGEYRVQFNGSELPSGVYIYSIKAGEFRDSKKLLLLK